MGARACGWRVAAGNGQVADDVKCLAVAVAIFFLFTVSAKQTGHFKGQLWSRSSCLRLSTRYTEGMLIITWVLARARGLQINGQQRRRQLPGWLI